VSGGAVKQAAVEAENEDVAFWRFDPSVRKGSSLAVPSWSRKRQEASHLPRRWPLAGTTAGSVAIEEQRHEPYAATAKQRDLLGRH
jgi:hypothetical protein